MRMTVLGSGGNTPTPMPTCQCSVCKQARANGRPYARFGNSLYLHDQNAIVDAPEPIVNTLAEYRIHDFEYVFLTHWHPDHVCGIRPLLQSRNSAKGKPTDDAIFNRPTLVTTRPVYEQAADLFHIDYYIEEIDMASVHFLDEAPLTIGETTVEAIPYSLDGEDPADAVAFVLTEADGTTTVIASDDAYHLDVTRLPDTIDLAVFECGLLKMLGDEQNLPDELFDTFPEELTHQDVLDRVSQVDPAHTLLTEIEHTNQVSHDTLTALEQTTDYETIQFAYDGRTLSL